MLADSHYFKKAIPRDYELGDVSEYPILKDGLILEGFAVGLDERGYARALEAGDRFVGFCEQTSDNTCGQDGDRCVRVKRCGAVKLLMEDIHLSHVGHSVFASGPDAFTLVADKNSPIGWIIRIDSPGFAIVAFALWHTA